jgi:anti-sigma B factor antagonist
MKISVKEINQISVVSAEGSVDALTASVLSEYLQSQIDAGHYRIVLDLGQIEFMSSAGLHAILITVKKTRQHGGDLYLAAAQPGVERVLKISGFTNLLNSYPNVDDALLGFV